MLYPIVKLLLRYEIAHSEFSELTRRSYVDVAFKDFGIPNRKNTVSRVSVITGLSRPEVTRLMATAEKDLVSTSNTTPNRATRVIGGWLSDAKFNDENNNPKVLPLRGTEISFESLVNLYSGGITARAVLDEMLRVGAVEKVDKDHVKLVHLGYVPQGDDSEKINIFLTHAGDLLSTGIHNLTQKDEAPRFQRQVTYVDMPERVVEEFEKLSRDKSMTLLVELNKWLQTKSQEEEAQPDEKTYRIGVGIYYFKNEFNNEE